MTVEMQFASFFTMLIVGFYLGCMFDTNECIIQMLKSKKVFQFIFQFFFWLFQSLLIFYSLVKINGGQVRFYFILAIVIGFYFYFFSFRQLYQAILERVIGLFRWIFTMIGRIINLILIKPFILVSRGFLFIINLAILIVVKTFLFLFKIVAWIFTPIMMIIPEKMKKYLKKPAGVFYKIENIIMNRKKD
ncbi:spore cortex biosynthesis protein YabQ [Amphibacillus sp. MSJ-3]|uniref:spore cortex biosynthesis protein YabQ n=1 Tax=Amphibacillus sp. MSJ-3 TaxID=2841505 RepID=UPI001C0EB20E|nr:spore cortex biosynthesis protein YabQ [Amphibacillus sp. MSJ-3]MBU5595540.1 spore cortex biosynthesis protein YabQ [Amphibacillus sp. MSJ-3]